MRPVDSAVGPLYEQVRIRKEVGGGVEQMVDCAGDLVATWKLKDSSESAAGGLQELPGGEEEELEIKPRAAVADVVKIVYELPTDTVDVGVWRKAELRKT